MSRISLSPLRVSFPRPLDLVLIAAAGAASLVMPAVLQRPAGAAVENGPIETAQFFVLVLATILLLRGSFRLAGWSAVTAIGLACFAIFCAVRETPRCNSPFYEFGPCISGDWKNLVYVSAALLILAVLVVTPGIGRASFGRRAFRMLPVFLPRLWPLLILIGFLLAAQTAEALHRVGLEEALELASYVLLALFGLIAAQAGDREVARADDSSADMGLRT